MKDIKTFIIGFLTCACLFLIMGQTNHPLKKDMVWFNQVYANEIILENDAGEAILIDGNSILIKDPHKKKSMMLSSRSIFTIDEELNVASVLSPTNIGLWSNFSKETIAAEIAISGERNGSLTINNQFGNNIAIIAASDNKDGSFVLLDRYGEPGWAVTGKK